jgi:hypothetical protein
MPLPVVSIDALQGGTSGGLARDWIMLIGLADLDAEVGADPCHSV